MSIVRNDLNILSPGEGGFTITRSDVNDLPRKTRGLYIGTSGNVRVLFANGNDVTLQNLAAGVVHPLQVIRVFETGTDAGLGIVGIV